MKLSLELMAGLKKVIKSDEEILKMWREEVIKLYKSHRCGDASLGEYEEEYDYLLMKFANLVQVPFSVMGV